MRPEEIAFDFIVGLTTTEEGQHVLPAIAWGLSRRMCLRTKQQASAGVEAGVLRMVGR